MLGLYAAYVAIFFAFNGAYYAFLAVRKRVLAKLALRTAPAIEQGEPVVAEEAAIAEEEEPPQTEPLEETPEEKEKQLTE